MAAASCSATSLASPDQLSGLQTPKSCQSSVDFTSQIPISSHLISCTPACMSSSTCSYSNPILQLAWPEHKKIHTGTLVASDAWLYVTKRGAARSGVMPDFAWTGALRPHPVSSRRAVSLRKHYSRSPPALRAMLLCHSRDNQPSRPRCCLFANRLSGMSTEAVEVGQHDAPQEKVLRNIVGIAVKTLASRG